VESRIPAPVVSVIIPVHGDAPHLSSTIESIKIQSLTEFESIIILDRASKDIEAYARNLTLESNKFKVVVSEKPGISNALNTGIRECSSEFIARIDADDVMHKDRLMLQKNFLEKNHAVVCVGSQVIKINVHGTRIGRSSYPVSNKQITSSLLFRNCIAHPSVMYRRSSVLQVSGYRPDFDGVEDYDLWLRLSMIGQIRNMQLALTSYRVWENQITKKKKHLILQNTRRVRESFEDILVSQKCNPRFRRKDWLLSADHFNKGLQKFSDSGEIISAVQNLFASFKITPSLTTRIFSGYILNSLLARIWSFNREN
jgi:glycosyltransferase involved in cell wall biosynthesis